MAHNDYINELGTILGFLGIIFVISLGTVFLLKKLNIPAVLGLIIGGLIIGIIDNHFLLVPDFILDLKDVVIQIALAWIGYDIGNDIDLNLLKDKGKSLALVLFAEAFGAFFFVTLGTFLILQDLGLALILGAIAMATDPASTSQVIGEYKATGELSQTLIFIIAFDDILAILLVNVAINISTTSNEFGLAVIFEIITILFQEITIALLLGVGGAIFINRISKIKGLDKKNIIEWMIGISLIIIGLNIILGGSPILSMFFFGIILKTEEAKNEILHEHVLALELIMIPIVLLFFIFIGFSMDFDLIIAGGLTFILTVFSYLFLRAVGKGIATYFFGKKSGLNPKCYNNLGFTLIPQAGVTIGLIALASEALFEVSRDNDALLILNIITSAVLVSQLIGPILVKWALFRAGEGNGG
ncbi:MAG: cation:proton antiporter [Candidatus Hodarchaeales archaeon]|jgi:Kef-type K+ transport system membrane component KefB